MKITPKPFTTHRSEPVLQPVVASPSVAAKQMAYQHLVTSQNVHPDRARELLQIPQK